MDEEFKCEACDKKFGSKDSFEQHNSAKHPEHVSKEKKPFPFKKIRNWGIFILIIAGIFAIIYFPSLNAEILPPIDMLGHVEASPTAHVLKEPMQIEVQKHMLEHIDGGEGARGGMIINYNCEDYSCETSLIEKLEEFGYKYDYVYVAPFKKMSVKIALTKLGKIETLDEYDEKRIELFLTGRLPSNEDSSISGNVVQEEVTSIEPESIKEFSMTAKQWQFIPEEITVNEGDTVKLSIKSIDVAHGILLREFGINEYLSPGNTVNIEFIADRKGEFSFFCNVSCGVGHTSMRGTIIVE